jgi:hypothetical protein
MAFDQPGAGVATTAAAGLGASHRRRLLALWRSAGWPSHDPIELDLLAAGLLVRRLDANGRETLQVTDAGIAVLAAARRRHQGARSPHEALIDRIAALVGREGRWAWRGLALWAAVPVASGGGASVIGAASQTPLPFLDADAGTGAGGETGAFSDADRSGPPAVRTAWVRTLPDLFSIRPSSRDDRLEPEVHEIKVQRSDLLADLRRPAKGAAYLALAGACTYVLGEGVGSAEDVPPPFGVMRAHGDALELLRPAQRRGVGIGLSTWLALARATPCAATDEPWPVPLQMALTAAPDGPDDPGVRGE